MKGFDISKIIPEYLRKIRPYHLGKSVYGADVIRLNRNENLFITLQQQQRVITDAISGFDPRRYGGVYNERIVTAIAKHYNVGSSQVYCGNGSDEIIYLLCKLLLPPRKRAILIQPTFGTYNDAVLAGDGIPEHALLTEDFQLDIDAIKKLVRRDTVLMFLDSPNNPSGNQFPIEDVIDIIDGFHGLVVVDEAYASFSSCSYLGLINEYNNVMILRTFSKDFGFAGLRLGYAFGSPVLISALKTFWQPYNVTTITQEAAVNILKHAEKYKEINTRVIEERKNWIRELDEIPGIRTFPSEANFILFRVDKDPKKVFEALLNKKIIVRDRSDYPRCENCLRVTVAPPRVRRLFISALREVMEDPKIS
ncbi:MAG: histidinol-phosphate transaminase [Candidatus Ranarchaeia archaeon]